MCSKSEMTVFAISWLWELGGGHWRTWMESHYQYQRVTLDFAGYLWTSHHARWESHEVLGCLWVCTEKWGPWGQPFTTPFFFCLYSSTALHWFQTITSCFRQEAGNTRFNGYHVCPIAGAFEACSEDHLLGASQGASKSSGAEDAGFFPFRFAESLWSPKSNVQQKDWRWDFCLQLLQKVWNGQLLRQG